MNRLSVGLFSAALILLILLILSGTFLPRTGSFEPLYFGWMPFWFFRLLGLQVLFVLWSIAFWLWDTRAD